MAPSEDPTELSYLEKRMKAIDLRDPEDNPWPVVGDLLSAYNMPHFASQHVDTENALRETFIRKAFVDNDGSDATPSALVFDEGPGYVLVKSLRHGVQGQVYLVRSLEDGTLYVLKHYPRSSLNSDLAAVTGPMAPDDDQTVEFSVYRYLPATVAPRIHHRTISDKGIVVIYEYCRGGDWDSLLQTLDTNAEKPLSEIIFWHIAKEIIGKVAWAHDGWAGNVFLQWTDEEQLLPSVLIGDWGSASIAPSNNPTAKENAYFMHRELHTLSSTLVYFHEDKYTGPRTRLTAVAHLEDLLEQSYGAKIEDASRASWVAERFIHFADQEIAHLQAAGESMDLRWTKDPLPTTILTWTGTCEQRVAKFLSWEANDNDQHFIMSPFHFAALNTLPPCILEHLVSPTTNDGSS